MKAYAHHQRDSRSGWLSSSVETPEQYKHLIEYAFSVFFFLLLFSNSLSLSSPPPFLTRHWIILFIISKQTRHTYVWRKGADV